MGYCREHRCPSCGYTAVVSGGPDVGMAMRYTLTISCRDCQKLHDVGWLEPKVTAGPPGQPDVQWKQLRLRCPQDAAHHWEPYTGQCPVCSEDLQINEEGEGYHWD